ncbi:BUD13 homolog isoform X3 [Cetorhinus maximus]
MAALTKEEYLKRYLSGSEQEPGRPGPKRRRRKVKSKTGGMRIVDDDVTWKSLAKEKEAALMAAESDEDDEAPVVAEFVDERPEIIQQMEEFRLSNKWKILGDEKKDSQESDLFFQTRSDGLNPDSKSVQKKRTEDDPQLPERKMRTVSPDLSPSRRGRHDSPDLSPPRRGRHDSPDLSPPRRGRHNSPDLSPPRRGRHDSPDLSPPRKGRHNSPDLSPPRRGRHDSPDLSPPRRGRHDSPDLSPPRKKLAKNTEKCVRPTDLPSRSTQYNSPDLSQRQQDPDSDLSPPRKGCQHSSDSDLSPPRRKKMETSDLDHKPSLGCSEPSPPRHRLPSHRPALLRGQGASQNSSPSRKPQVNEMLSGGQAGLISTEVLRKEKEDRRQRLRAAERVADDSRNATTIFRDKSGKKRDLDQERIEHKKKEEEKAAKQEKYAQWGKGVAQEEQQKKNVIDALHEMQKPLARHIDDEDLDRFLREKERDGDPMAGLIRKKKEKEAKNKNEKPVYSGPAPPPNRFNLYPGYRWDGVDRSNGFEQKRYARLADKKAVQEIAYKWSVEDM